ncbi:MAG TPA: hypothetical protein VNH18_12495 [Bryobacteraceae bacterium]|nr:hypothetical protein [Bryobacteraceae bacterium]
MKLFFAIIPLVFALSLPGTAATPARSAGSANFDDADSSLQRGATMEAAAAAEKGWAAVLAAGVTAPGFIDGVYQASRIFDAVGRKLRAEAVYNEAENMCASPALQVSRVRLQYMHADRLIRNSEYVKAEGVLRAALSATDRAAQKSSFYVALLQTMAFLREQQGDPEGAEAFYRMTIGRSQPDLSGVVVPMFSWSKQRLPFVGEPRSSMAAFYSNHGRMKEAEILYREQLAEPSLTQEERLGAMRQLVSFLSVHGSKADAIAMEEQVIGLLKTHPLTTSELRDGLANEHYTLANLQADAGRAEDGKALLESDLRQAEAHYGKNSPEYTEALNYYFENRRYTRDYDTAEKLAREEVERAEAEVGSERVSLASAMFRLADMLREKGQIAESEALRAKTIRMNRAAFPEPASTAQFADAEGLVKAGKPGEAVRVARQIPESAAQSDIDSEQFGFLHLAQSMAGEHKAEAAEIASIALLTDERRRLPDDPRLARDLTDWANFYRGVLRQPDRALDLLTRAEAIVRACCGTESPTMEPVLQERAWLAMATAGQGAGIPFLEQLRALRISIYGAMSQEVQQADRELSEAKAKAAQ